MRYLWLFLLFLSPNVSAAAVTFSEIAWMGTSESANHEWIELHNDGAETDITGWVLSDGMNLSIELVGTIPAGAYSVLERTSDESVSGTAFLIYTGALVNTGATLKLDDSSGNLVDQVAGGEDWVNIGGDNVTKETAQYTTSGWVTAIATPARGISSSEVEQSLTEPEEVAVVKTESSSVSSGNAGEPVRLVVPNVTLQLSVDAQTVGYVNQPISFTVTATDIGDTLIDSLLYEWNFGDGTTDIEKDTQHIFKYPGTYVVTIYAGYKRQEQVSRHEITILPVAISLTMNRVGDVQINNDSPYEIDISGYRILGEKTFVFPPRSIMLPNQTVTIPKVKLGQTRTRMVGVYDGESLLIASTVPDIFEEPAAQLAVVPESEIKVLSLVKQTVTIPPSDFKFVVAEIEADIVSEKIVSEPITVLASSSTLELTATTTKVPDSDSPWAYLALIMILALGIVGVYTSVKPDEDS